jgi:hypothetical protein
MGALKTAEHGAGSTITLAYMNRMVDMDLTEISKEVRPSVRRGGKETDGRVQAHTERATSTPTPSNPCSTLATPRRTRGR